MTTPAENPLRVLTIGHSNSTVDEIVSLLREYGVHVVVDVRSVPYSQYVPQFNRETFEAALVAARIDYRFAGEYLGGRPTDPTCYKNGEVPTGKADYLQLVDYDEVAKRPWFQKGLDRLIQLTERQTVAVMCSEEDPGRCHRHHLIARELLAQELEVEHIRHPNASQRYLESDAAVSERLFQPSQLPLL